MKPLPPFYYTCWGPATGGCGLRHANLDAAHACMDAEMDPACIADRAIRFVPDDPDITVAYDGFARAQRAGVEAAHAN